MLPKLGGMAIYGTIEIVLKPPTELPYGVKNPPMAKKEDFFTFADSFEINTPHQLFRQPCVTKTERYGYIRNYGGCVEPSHRTTIGCEKG